MFSLSSSYISFRRKERRGERRNELVVACSSSRYGWSLLAKVFLQKIPKKERGVLLYIFLCVCVCVISTPSSSFRLHTHRENNNNNNELYVFVLILKWRNELLSRDDNHRNHKMSDAEKRRSWNTTTATTTCTTFFRRIGKKRCGVSSFYDSFVLRVLVAMTTRSTHNIVSFSQWPTPSSLLY